LPGGSGAEPATGRAPAPVGGWKDGPLAGRLANAGRARTRIAWAIVGVPCAGGLVVDDAGHGGAAGSGCAPADARAAGRAS
jgi:hypothetical protein